MVREKWREKKRERGRRRLEGGKVDGVDGGKARGEDGGSDEQDKVGEGEQEWEYVGGEDKGCVHVPSVL